MQISMLRFLPPPFPFVIARTNSGYKKTDSFNLKLINKVNHIHYMQKILHFFLEINK